MTSPNSKDRNVATEPLATKAVVSFHRKIFVIDGIVKVLHSQQNRGKSVAFLVCAVGVLMVLALAGSKRETQKYIRYSDFFAQKGYTPCFLEPVTWGWVSDGDIYSFEKNFNKQFEDLSEPPGKGPKTCTVDYNSGDKAKVNIKEVKKIYEEFDKLNLAEGRTEFSDITYKRISIGNVRSIINRDPEIQRWPDVALKQFKVVVAVMLAKYNTYDKESLKSSFSLQCNRIGAGSDVGGSLVKRMSSDSLQIIGYKVMTIYQIKDSNPVTRRSEKTTVLLAGVNQRNRQ